MKKLNDKKIRAREYIKQLRCNIKTMRVGRMSDMQGVYDAFEIKLFGKGENCKIERKKGFLRGLLQK